MNARIQETAGAVDEMKTKLLNELQVKLDKNQERQEEMNARIQETAGAVDEMKTKLLNELQVKLEKNQERQEEMNASIQETAGAVDEMKTKLLNELQVQLKRLHMALMGEIMERTSVSNLAEETKCSIIQVSTSQTLQCKVDNTCVMLIPQKDGEADIEILLEPAECGKRLTIVDTINTAETNVTQFFCKVKSIDQSFIGILGMSVNNGKQFPNFRSFGQLPAGTNELQCHHPFQLALISTGHGWVVEHSAGVDGLPRSPAASVLSDAIPDSDCAKSRSAAPCSPGT
jgi:hypothetical protein